VSYTEVHDLAARVGMPHGSLSMHAELTAMLSFFTSINAVLWHAAHARTLCSSTRGTRAKQLHSLPATAARPS
jgi:hypothetical protein